MGRQVGKYPILSFTHSVYEKFVKIIFLKKFSLNSIKNKIVAYFFIILTDVNEFLNKKTLINPNFYLMQQTKVLYIMYLSSKNTRK